jgi:hypothetical protein
MGPDGELLDLIGKPLHLRPGPAPGIRVIVKGTTAMPKAEANGVYIDKNGNRFRIREGDELPAGATMEADVADEAQEAEAEPEARDKGAAPENRKKS